MYKSLDMKNLVVVIAFCWFAGVVFGQTTDHLDTIEGRGEKIENQKATVVVEVFTDKGGRKHPEIVDYYLAFDDKQYFIKFSESTISPGSLKPLVGKSVYFYGYLKNGLWDTDDPNVQSRIGKYLKVTRLMK